MKILMATTYIYDEQWPEFTRNKTGFGIMVNDIFHQISDRLDTYLYTQVITSGRNNRKICKHTYLDVITNLRISDILQAIKWFFLYRDSLKLRLRNVFCCLDKGYFRKVIKAVEPDLIHIHGIGLSTKTFIEVCEELNIKYVVTLHGIIGMDDSVLASSWDKEYEKEFLIEADRRNIPVSVISSGIKRRIEEQYLGHKSTNIEIITNGTKIPFKNILVNDQLDIRNKLKISSEVKICTVVGSICERKNQFQIIDAVEALTKEERSKIMIVLCGADRTFGKFEERIKEKSLENNFCLLGFITKDELSSVFSQAYMNIIASYDEGFGFSIIEAYMHGVPTVTFSNLDAVEDLYNEETMILSPSRDTKSFSDAISKGLKKNWNKDFIMEYGKKFSLEKMAQKYEEEYFSILRTGGLPNIADTIDYLRIQKYLGKKILVYIGNITVNKNQREAVRFSSYLDDSILFLFGNERDNHEVRNLIIDLQNERRVFLAGFCSELDDVWQYADLNIFLSLNDGFGLSIIEGYMRGVPCVFYLDIDAAEDVQIESGTFMLHRSDNYISIIDKINHVLSMPICKRSIMKDSMKYNSEMMADKYISLYVSVNKKEQHD